MLPMLNRAAAAIVLAFVFAAACSEQEAPGAPSAPIPEGAPAAAVPFVHGTQPVASAADARGEQPRVHNATMGYLQIEVDVSARDSGLDVTWSGVSEHAERVRVRVFVGAGRDAVHDETVGASTTSATIPGLTNGVGYQVQVDALGPGGFGLGGGRGAGTPRSGVVSVPRPGQVVGVRVSPVAGGVRVSWSSPGDSSHNQYRIDAVAQGVDHRRRHYVDAGTTQLVVDRLLNGVTYAVTVRALHRTGGPDGPDSVPVSGMPVGHPPKVTGVAAEHIISGYTLSVEWQPLAVEDFHGWDGEKDGPLPGYRIQIRDFGSPWHPWWDWDQEAYWRVVTGRKKERYVYPDDSILSFRMPCYAGVWTHRAAAVRVKALSSVPGIEGPWSDTVYFDRQWC